jgi:hypothetical protein
MTRDLPSWLSEDDDAAEPTSPTRRWLLLAAATLPWLVLGGLLATGALSTGAAPSADTARVADTDPAVDAGTPAPSDHPAAAHEAPPATPAPAAADDAPAGPADRDRLGVDLTPPAAGPSQEAAALAVVIARAWLTDVGPRLRVEGVDPRPDQYLEQAVVESVTVHDDLAVVGLLAVVLGRDGDHYGEVAVRRVAVPIGLTSSGPRPAGRPWWLPDPDLRLAPPRLEVLEDPDLGVATAEVLAAHGYGDVEIVRLATHGSGLLVAELSARLDDEREVEGPVWLRMTPSGPQLVGAAEPPLPPLSDAPAPSDDDSDLRDHHVEENP